MKPLSEKMTTQVEHPHATCRKLVSLGYARVRLYGQELQLISDPFPQDGGIAVEVASQNDSVSRTMRLPLPVLQIASPKRTA